MLKKEGRKEGRVGRRERRMFVERVALRVTEFWVLHVQQAEGSVKEQMSTLTKI